MCEHYVNLRILVDHSDLIAVRKVIREDIVDWSKANVNSSGCVCTHQGTIWVSESGTPYCHKRKLIRKNYELWVAIWEGPFESKLPVISICPYRKSSPCFWCRWSRSSICWGEHNVFLGIHKLNLICLLLNASTNWPEGLTQSKWIKTH